MSDPLNLMDHLMELAERELAAGEALHARAMAAADTAEYVRLSRAYIRSASTVRRLLKRRHELEREHLRQAKAGAAAEWPDGRAGGVH